jgi:transcriptional regulator with PAS, ATPase and Fis domain
MAAVGHDDRDLCAPADSRRLDDFAAMREQAMQTVFRAFDRACEGTIIVDRDCRILWINGHYAQRFGFEDPAAAIGRRVEDVIPNSRMREVIETGRPILLDILEAPKKPLVVIRLPLKEGGEVIGAVGFALFDEWATLSPLVSRFLTMQEELAAARKARPPLRQAKYNFSNIVGTSPATLELKRTARRAAATHSPVLLLGETGTGKELLAHAIHGASPRAHKPFVSISMAAIPDALLEAELFGVAPGAFTGADRRERQGKLHVAQGGTLFLDEIGDMPLALQAKLLRVLQEKEFEAIGSNEVVRADVRIIAATSRHLAELVKRGEFRADLYYRLDVLAIRVPPLRERIDDLEPICESILEGFAEAQPGRHYEVHPDALALLARQRWPGNIRELRNVLERSMVLTDSTLLTEADVQAALSVSGAVEMRRDEDAPAAGQVPEPPGEGHARAMSQYERRLIERALATSPSVAAAAKRLGLGRATLYRKMAALGLTGRGRLKLPPASPPHQE